MFVKTSDFISKHSKAIISFWIVLLVIPILFGMKAVGVEGPIFRRGSLSDGTGVAEWR